MIAKFKLIFALFFVVAANLVSAAELEHPAKPMLWKLEGGELTKPSYLFGTIHLGDENLTTLHPAAQKAFDGAATVHTEVAMDPQNQLKMAEFLMRDDGKTLSDAIGEDLKARVEAQLKKINPQLNLAPFEEMRTWALAMLHPAVIADHMAGRKELDLLLWERAEQAGKATKALERPEDQLGKLNLFTEEEQLVMIEEAIKQLEEIDKGGPDYILKIKEAYLKRDFDQLSEVLSMVPDEHQELTEKFNRLMLHGRNVGMVESIMAQLAEAPDQSHFFAAGTAHYLGDKSVNELLEKAGYKVTLVND